MTLSAQIAWDDTVLPFQLDRSDIRGRVARLDGVLDGILKQHDYPPAVEALVARAPDKFTLVRTPEQAEQALKDGLIGLAMGTLQPGHDDSGNVRARDEEDEEGRPEKGLYRGVHAFQDLVLEHIGALFPGVRAAMESGVATRPIADFDAYLEKLSRFVFRSGTIMKTM